MLSRLVPAHKSQTTFCIPRQQIIQRVQLFDLESAGLSLFTGILTVNGSSCCTSFTPFQSLRACALSTMPFTNAFPSSCGYSTLLSCSLGSGWAARRFYPTTCRNNHLFHELIILLSTCFRYSFSRYQAKGIVSGYCLSGANRMLVSHNYGG